MATDKEKIEALKDVVRSAVRALCQLGISQAEISEITGLGAGAVHLIVQGVKKQPRPSCCVSRISVKEHGWTAGTNVYSPATKRNGAGVRHTMSAEEEAQWLSQMNG